MDGGEERRPPGAYARRLKRWGFPIAAGLFLVGKLALKFKLALFALLKYGGALLKTGGTMLLSIGFYATAFGWAFALGFVLQLFVHECGHLVAARRLGLRAGWPVFIPFMGAFIALKDAPKDAWVEAQVGIGGPLLGTAGAIACELVFLATGEPLFAALAYVGFLLNLFNLAPVGFLDGGRVAAALSPWLWIAGMAALVALLLASFNLIVLLVLVMSLPRVISLFRAKSDAERRYYEVAPARRLAMGALYFGLLAVCAAGMAIAHAQSGAAG